MKIKLAEALLRRKELQMKVDQLQQIKAADIFECHFKRQKITDSVDDIEARVPKLTASQVTREYDEYAAKLRLVDAAIQQTNWTTDIEIDSKVTDNFSG